MFPCFDGIVQRFEINLKLLVTCVTAKRYTSYACKTSVILIDNPRNSLACFNVRSLISIFARKNCKESFLCIVNLFETLYNAW